MANYLSVYMPGHPRAAKTCNMVYVHLLVAEKALGKPVPRRAQVHHVNEDTYDNRPCNLVICENAAYHRLLHRRANALDACGNPNWVRCALCKQHDAPGNLYMPRGREIHARHRECHRLYVNALSARKHAVAS